MYVRGTNSTYVVSTLSTPQKKAETLMLTAHIINSNLIDSHNRKIICVYIYCMYTYIYYKKQNFNSTRMLKGVNSVVMGKHINLRTQLPSGSPHVRWRISRTQSLACSHRPKGQFSPLDDDLVMQKYAKARVMHG